MEFLSTQPVADVTFRSDDCGTPHTDVVVGHLQRNTVNGRSGPAGVPQLSPGRRGLRCASRLMAPSLSADLHFLWIYVAPPTLPAKSLRGQDMGPHP